MEVFDTNGADAMRWHLLSSPILRGTDFVVTARGLRDTARQILLPLWNAWYFLTLYANAAGVEGDVRDGVERPLSTHVLDRYVLAKTRDLVEDVTRAMDAYDLFGACASIRAFVETLTNWYIRRSRQRFWDGDDDAIDTLHTVLDVLARVAAPLLPFVTEEIYSGLRGAAGADGSKSLTSPHLADWPLAEDLPGDEALVRTMDEVRDVCSATLSVRKAHGRRVRQPLSSVTVAAPDAEALRPFVDIIADEVNVREVVLTDDVESVARQRLQVVPSVIGPRLGPETQDVIRAVREGRWVSDDDAVVAGGHRLEPGEFVLTLQADDEAASAALSSGVGVVVVNVDVTEELEIEGQARDLVRMVQQARRDRDLAVTDRIDLRVKGDERWATVVRAHEKFIADETLAVSLEIDDSGTDAPEIDLDVVADWQPG
jgi:isoleucyl-tRNA synthetase